jgi:mRNA interferase RelE/StbE
MWSIEYKRPARKALQRMPVEMARRFLTAFDALAHDPGRQDLDLKPLQGRRAYRLRIGAWRAIYVLEHERLIILVLEIGSRGGIYK